MVTRQVTNGLDGDGTGWCTMQRSELQDHHPTQRIITSLTSSRPPNLNHQHPHVQGPAASSSVPPRTPLPPPHSALTASFSRLPSSPSLLSPPLRWWTIDLRNEVGLLSRIYTGFSLCVSDRFPPVRHSLSLRIFMLVRTRQRTQEQGEDAPETALPLASSPSPLGRGFLGLTLVGFVGFFFILLFATALAANPAAAAPSDASQGRVILSRSLQDGATRMEPPLGLGRLR